MNNSAINAGDAVKNITLKVKIKGLNTLQARIVLGCFFIRIAAFVIGCNIKIEE